MARKLKVLMVAHGHPDFNPGGGEIAAYQLHKALNNRCSGTQNSTLAGNAKYGTDGTEEVEYESIFLHGMDKKI